MWRIHRGHIGCICTLFKRIQKIILEPFLKVFGPLNNFCRCFSLLATSNRHLRISQTLSQSGTNLRSILCLVPFPATWLVGKSQVFVLEISSHHGRRTTPKTISQYIKPTQFDCANLGQQVLSFSVHSNVSLFKWRLRYGKRIYLLQAFFSYPLFENLKWNDRVPANKVWV